MDVNTNDRFIAAEFAALDAWVDNPAWLGARDEQEQFLVASAIDDMDDTVSDREALRRITLALIAHRGPE